LFSFWSGGLPPRAEWGLVGLSPVIQGVMAWPRSAGDREARAETHSRKDVWIKRSALSLVWGV
jgi:hypothetical protein